MFNRSKMNKRLWEAGAALALGAALIPAGFAVWPRVQAWQARQELNRELREAAQQNTFAIVRQLVERGADRTILREAAPPRAVLLAAVVGDVPFLQQLLSRGVDPNATVAERIEPELGWDYTIEGVTPLMLAAEYGELEAVQVLVQHGARVDAKDGLFGQTPLMHAAEGGHARVARHLLEHGASVEARDTRGETALCIAAQCARAEDAPGYQAPQPAGPCVAEVLLAHEADVNTTPGKSFGNEVGDTRTPLHWAAEGGGTITVKALLAAGADLNAKDGAGDTPLAAALKAGHPEVVALLKQAGAKR
jgi:ankyrin repeat protein